MFTLYRKTILAIGATLVALLLLVYTVSQATLIRGFERVEEMNTATNLQRAYWALIAEMSDVESLAVDWSHWDETYQFVHSGSPQFAEANLMDSAFINLNLHLGMILNRDAKIIFQRVMDPNTNMAAPADPELESHVKPGGLLVTHLTTNSRVSGILHLSTGDMYVVAVPILTSEGSGPIRGTLIFGRYITPQHLTELGERVRLNVSIRSFTDPNLPVDFQAAKTALLEGEPHYVNPINESRVSGFQAIRDIYGRPAMLLRVEMGRGIFQQGQISMAYFLIALGVVGVGLAAVVLLLLDRGILRRLQTLSAAMTHVRNTGDLNAQVTINGNDELNTLAHGLNSMLAALGQSQKQVEQSNDQLRQANERLTQLNDELEQRVSERTHALSVANDQLRQEVAERQQAQAQLAQARDQALEALRLKNQILANVSHDARTPLTSIILHTELLQRGSYGAVDHKQKEKLDNVLLSARQLLTFINNMLGEAQINNGKIRLADEPFAPAQLLTEIGTMVQPLADRKKIDFTTDIDTTLPPMLRGDAERLKQIVTNLIDNAIKFTDRGIVAVRLFKRDDAHWCIEVKDNGRGIPAEAQGRIFDAFWQVDGSVTRETNRGVGLGLSIVKQLVQLMDGQINLASMPDQGTTFSVVLPLILPQPAPAIQSISA